MYKLKTFVLFHYPVVSWDGLNKGHIHLHGHVHLPTSLRFGKGKKMDVGVDGNGLDPYSIDEIIKIMDKRAVGSDMSGDHHLDGLVQPDESILNWDLHQNIPIKTPCSEIITGI